MKSDPGALPYAWYGEFAEAWMACIPSTHRVYGRVFDDGIRVRQNAEAMRPSGSKKRP